MDYSIYKSIISKKIIFFEKGMIQECIEYMFPEMKPSYYINVPERLQEGECPVDKIAEEKDFIIICCTQKRKSSFEVLEKMGLVYKKDFVGYKEVIELLDYFRLEDMSANIQSLMKKRGIVLLGISDHIDIFLDLNRSVNIDYIIDTDNLNIKHYANIAVADISKLSFDDVKEKFIIITHDKFYEIIQELCKKKLCEGKDFIYCQNCRTVRPSEMFEILIKAKTINNKVCKYPFTFAQFVGGGDVKLCCLGLKLSSGNINEMHFNGIWNSALSRLVRLSAITGKYCFCDSITCPMLPDIVEKPYHSIQYKRNSAENYPEKINISIDHTCNLYCESCRSQILAADKNEKEEIRAFSNVISSEVLPYVKRVILAGNGEVFVSEIYRSIFQDEKIGHENLELAILTNGNLFDEENWGKIKMQHRDIGLSVSIDAYTEATYKKLRRGGDFSKLKKNLEFASFLRKSGELVHFQMNFVVCSENVHEMGNFVEWGHRLGADRIRFSQLENWIYPKCEFSKKSVFSDSGIKPEFQRYFQDERLKDKVVDMRNIEKWM